MKRQIPIIIWICIVIGFLLSAYLVVYESNFIFKQEVFSKKVVLESGGADAGYINLKSDSRTPSAVEWARFRESGEKYVFFSVLDGQYVEKNVDFNLPQEVEKGKYYVSFEVKYLSGKVESGVISFSVYP